MQFAGSVLSLVAFALARAFPDAEPDEQPDTVSSRVNVAKLLPTEATFKTLEEMAERCRGMTFYTTAETLTLDDFRMQIAAYYESETAAIGPSTVFDFIWPRRVEIAGKCPHAVLQVIVLRIEKLLLGIYTNSAHSRNKHLSAFGEASDLHYEAQALEAWTSSTLGIEGETPRLGWALERGWERVRKYYDLLWSDVYQSGDDWSTMENPGETTDAIYHASFDEVAKVLTSLEVEWWPCRGTLIAMLRHGKRSGPLSRGLVDVVERDIDIMLGVPDEKAWVRVSRVIQRELIQLGWDRCWTKTSANLSSSHRDAVRRDLLYCMRLSPAYMLVDISSYITGAPGTDVFIHRFCGGLAVEENSLDDQGTCEILKHIGPLQHNGGLLPKSAIHPLGRCRAAGISVPCPSKPLETIKAMIHSGLNAGCVALPTTVGRDAVEFYTRRLQESGLTAEDVRILKSRSARLDASGFMSMTPYFDMCDQQINSTVVLSAK